MYEEFVTADVRLLLQKFSYRILHLLYLTLGPITSQVNESVFFNLRFQLGS